MQDVNLQILKEVLKSMAVTFGNITTDTPHVEYLYKLIDQAIPENDK